VPIEEEEEVRDLESYNIFKNPGISIKEGTYFLEFSEK
jgi:hypothetical protein